MANNFNKRKFREELNSVTRGLGTRLYKKNRESFNKYYHDWKEAHEIEAEGPASNR